MTKLFVYDRKEKIKTEEKVFGDKTIRLLYGGGFFGSLLAHLAAKIPFVSAFYATFQKTVRSKKKIIPFIRHFEVDATEFLNSIDSFQSFNDFFIRKLKPSSRPLAKAKAVCPADGRYRIYPDISKTEGFWVKGEKFLLKDFLDDPKLAEAYEKGTLILARLAPPDYHRFHFPVDGFAHKSKLINGWLYSVNPMALKKDIQIFTKNKRRLTRIDSPDFGAVLMLEVGATNVGSIHETYVPESHVKKGGEKGYFSFGASLVALIFKPGSIKIESDLLDLSRFDIEIKCEMGQPLGNNTTEAL